MIPMLTFRRWGFSFREGCRFFNLTIFLEQSPFFFYLYIGGIRLVHGGAAGAHWRLLLNEEQFRKMIFGSDPE